MMREMLLIAFMQASNCSNYTGSWRHRETAANFLDLRYFQDIAVSLEAAKFHMAFIDDRLAMPSVYGDSFEEAVANGVRVVKLDLVPVITAMGLATTRLGLAATYSTTYYSPFHVARLFASIDHFTGGTAAWNVVTSLNDAEAQNFGVTQHLEHDERYDVADEFMEAACSLWDSWEAGAVIGDKDKGLFADPGMVHRADYAGSHFQTPGPLTVPRPPPRPSGHNPGRPERTGPAVCRPLGGVAVRHLPDGRRLPCLPRRDAGAGSGGRARSPGAVKVAPAVYVVVGDSENAAREKLEYLESLARPVDSLALLSEVFNYDFGRHPVNEPLDDATLASMTGLRGFLDRVIQLSGTQNPTVNDFIRWSGRGTLSELPLFVGDPVQVADQMESWFSSGACDGFVLAATHMPGAYDEFAALVVPELQRRGLFRTSYTPGALRDNLGFPAQE